MAKISVRYMVRRKRENGSMRYYWQPDEVLRAAGWKMARLSDDLGEAMAQAEAKNQAVDQWRANQIDKPVNEAPGTIDALIADYKDSRDYKKLGHATKQDYDRYLKVISQWAGDQPAVAITSKMVQTLYGTFRDKQPRKALYIIQVGRRLYTHGERQNLIAKGSNPFTDPGTEYKAPKGNIWPPEAVRHFVKTADDMGYFSIGTAIALNEWLGQRPGDIITMKLDNYQNGAIILHQSKTGAGVDLPVNEIPELKTRLEQQIEHYRQSKISGTHLIQRLDGQPFTKNTFYRLFQFIKTEAAKDMPLIADLVFKDMRHTAVTRLGEAGASVPQIASITGHSLKTCSNILETYLVRTKKMASEAFRLRRDAQLTTTKEGEKL